MPEVRKLLPTFVIACACLACGRNRALEAVEREPLYGGAFTGLALADAATGELLAARDAAKLFTPASNAKLLTLATALAWLPPDSVPALAYRYVGDTLRLWGLAYPLLAADEAPYNQALRRRLAAHPGPVEVSVHGFAELPRFGAGWMWDDFAGGYQRERSGLPVYGNRVSAWRRSDSTWGTRPSFLAVRASPVLPQGRLSRPEGSNRLSASAKTPIPPPGSRPADTLTVPLYAAQSLTAQLLEDWTGRPVRHHADALPADWGSRVWRGEPRDTLLRRMMLPSDNFLAEQLLLSAGLFAHDLTDGDDIRRRATAEVLPATVAEQLRWADASGLSHYNLASPRALVAVLVDLYNAHDWDRLSRLLPAGGESGTTLANDYASAPGTPPYLYAKTGTLRHNHCLSGYLRADSGRILAFSLMHNHFPDGSRAYREAMARTLLAIKAAY